MTQSPYPPPPPGYQAYGPPREDTVMGVLAHLSLFVFGVLVPLILYLIVKDDPTKPMSRHHALEALNFHISVTIYMLACFPLIFIIIGIFLMLGLFIASCVLAIVAAVAAGKRQPYRYPLTIRFVK